VTACSMKYVRLTPRSSSSPLTLVIASNPKAIFLGVTKHDSSASFGAIDRKRVTTGRLRALANFVAVARVGFCLDLRETKGRCRMN